MESKNESLDKIDDNKNSCDNYDEDGDDDDDENLWHALPILALLYLDLGQQGGGAVHVVVWLNLDDNYVELTLRSQL